MAKKKLKIMVSSTVYGSDSDLDQIKYTLENFGYKVVMSKEGSVYVPIDSNPTEACLKAVEDCDLFFGIIFPRYGSGITHKEFRKAIDVDKPMWFVSHTYIEYTRKLMQQFMFDDDKKRLEFDIKPTSVLDSLKAVDMYNLVRHKWVQPFVKIDDILSFINVQFKDIDARRAELKKRNNNE
jgi:hypothetical protein